MRECKTPRKPFRFKHLRHATKKSRCFDRDHWKRISTRIFIRKHRWRLLIRSRTGRKEITPRRFLHCQIAMMMDDAPPQSTAIAWPWLIAMLAGQFAWVSLTAGDYFWQVLRFANLLERFGEIGFHLFRPLLTPHAQGISVGLPPGI